MLIDNKTKNDDDFTTVFQLLEQLTEKGKLDVVSGYFSFTALALIYDKLKKVEQFRMVLGDIIEDKQIAARRINLLSEDVSVDSALKLSKEAQKAVDFLKQEIVEVKTVEPNFCHAKTYIYTDGQNKIQKSYSLIGSSNVTMAGLGLKVTSNVELNTATIGSNNDFKDLVKWFSSLWNNPNSKEKITVDGQVKIYKEYLIESIENFFRKFTPEELYYKTLFELFGLNLPELDESSAFQNQIVHLKETDVFRILYPFQQKGVLSLIRMLQNYNGAILADAVGLGKTWQALAVMKYFQLQGYEVILLCPKKLDLNWRRYLKGQRSRFEADRLDYTIRYHSDLQDQRLENKQDGLKIKTFFQRNPKVLFVIDESHNLRNDKSNRYRFLVDTLLRQNKDVKMLLLSATPINNYLLDVRNQFKLMCKGDDAGFAKTDLEVNSLNALFQQGQKEFNLWRKEPERKISDFIAKLPQRFFDLTDALIVARTRKMIAAQTQGLHFPVKQPPKNEYVNLDNLGKLHSFGSILDALKINMIGYRPSEFCDLEKAGSVLEDEVQREKFLAKMMYILLVKRLESSWYSFDITVENIYNHHKNALEKVERFLKFKEDNDLGVELEPDDEDLTDAAEMVEAQQLGDDDPTNDDDNPLEATLGKKRKIKLSEIVHIEEFKSYLEEDITQLEYLRNNISLFKKQFQKDFEKGADLNQSFDKKLARLIELLNEKQATNNPKAVIFTTYKDTAVYLFDQLKQRGFERLGLVTGTQSTTTTGIRLKNHNFEPILEAFAPYTKLYLEKDWRTWYEEKGIEPPANFEAWKTFIRQNDADTAHIIDNPVDILIATDCISEGQNLQDCDMVINYDIHWNPVRLIQRFGRIDRLGSPNATVMGVNFWPGKNFDDYLNLKSRVEDRMALFTLVGSEFNENLTPELREKVKDNPLVSRQTERMLAQMQTTWDDIEDSPDNLGLDKLSLEEFRQDLFDYFQNKRKEIERIPNGVFTGFKIRSTQKERPLPQGIIALLRYKHTPPGEKPEHFLLYASADSGTHLLNHHDVLGILKRHKKDNRYVPAAIERSDESALAGLAAQIGAWLDKKAGKQAEAGIRDLFEFGLPDTPTEKEKTKDQRLLEEKFRKENFDLITWFILS